MTQYILNSSSETKIDLLLNNLVGIESQAPMIHGKKEEF